MGKTVLKLMIVLAVVFAFIKPVRSYIAQKNSERRMDFNEKENIGSLHKSNPRVQEIQVILRDMSLYHGPVDGVMGARTRSAIQEFQRRQGLPATGKIDAKTFTLLSKQKFSDKPGKGANSKIVVALQPSSKNLSDKAPEEQEKIQKGILQHRLESKERIAKIQAALKKTGHYAGKVDGKRGAQTRKAIISFQEENKLKADGVVGTKTWDELKKYMPEGKT